MITKFPSWLVLIVVGVFTGIQCAPMVRADSLELKNGQIIQGRFLGGSQLNIRFQVDGKEQIFATKDVLNISFSDTTVDNSGSPASSLPGAGRGDSSGSNPSSLPSVGANAQATVPAANPTNETHSALQQSFQPGQAITIRAGTSIIVRMIDTVDSSTNKIGDTFHASLESALVVDDTVVAPKGADVYGKLAQAKEAGKISGGAELTLELTGLRINGNIVPVDSTEYDVAGKGRGKQSAERVGGGAVLGAIIGGIAGGGKGAAIGAGVGAGAGTGVQLATHGEKIRVPSETLLEFKLQQDVTARVFSPGQSN